MVKLVSMLESLKKTPIDLSVLAKLIPKSCKTMQFKHLKGKHRSEIFKDNEGIVVLIPSKVSKIGHFICLLPRRHHIEYFSSLGGSPDEELNKLHQSHDIMKKLLGNNYVYNSVKLQSGKYNIKDCASFVLMRLYFRHLKLREFQKLFSRNIQLSTPDDIASAFTALLLTE